MRALRLLPWVFPLLLAAAGCPTLPAPVPCGEIPPGGCPAGRGGTCDDPACTGLYDCVDGHWVSAQVCPQPDGGPPPDGGGFPDAGGPCTPPVIDADGGVSDCTPDLEPPDCPYEAAFPCAETACLTGCADFFLCKSDGWHQVAFCTDDGELVVSSDGPRPP